MAQLVARLTPDQKAACSSHVGVNVLGFFGGLGPIPKEKLKHQFAGHKSGIFLLNIDAWLAEL